MPYLNDIRTEISDIVLLFRMILKVLQLSLLGEFMHLAAALSNRGKRTKVSSGLLGSQGKVHSSIRSEWSRWLWSNWKRDIRTLDDAWRGHGGGRLGVPTHQRRLNEFKSKEITERYDNYRTPRRADCSDTQPDMQHMKFNDREVQSKTLVITTPRGSN